MLETAIQGLVSEFVTQLVGVVESATADRIQQALARAAIFQPGKRGPGRPRKDGLLSGSLAVALAQRKQPPKQLCPVPGCKNPAAPVFGMVCKEHKDVPKTKIKEYRAARKAAKAAGKGRAKPANRGPKAKRLTRASKKVSGARTTAAKVSTSTAATAEAKSE